MPTTGPRNRHRQILLYVHEDRLGDALLKLPAVATLKTAFPDSHITWLAGRGRSVFATELKPLVAEILDRVEDGIALGGAWSELWRRPAIRDHQDVIIDTQTIIKSTLALRRLPHSLFVTPAAGFRWSDRRPPPGSALAGSLQQRLMQLINLASGRQLEPAPIPALPGEYEREAARLLTPGPVYVGIAPGAGGRDKRWPLEGFLELGREQLRCDRVPVFLLGPEERQWLPVIRERVPEARIPEHERGLQVRPGPLLALALARRLAAAVANDSGVGHVLAAAGCPLVSLFGRTSVEKFADGRGHRRVLRAVDFGGDAAVAGIPPQAVNTALEGLLGETRSPGPAHA